MRYLVNGHQMKELDSYSIQTIGIPSMVLMERAALCTVQEMKKRIKDNANILIFCGSGNNGADGLAMARMLTLSGYSVEICMVGNRERATQEWRSQATICEKMNIPMEDYSKRDWELDRYDVLVDSMLGTGLSREVSGKYEECIRKINEAPAYVVAVDIPSGLSSDNGQILGTAVQADLTVSFQYQKLGTVFYPGAEMAGECVVADIGIVPQGREIVKTPCWTWGADESLPLPERRADSNKGTYGKVLIAAGTRNMAGAAILAGRAAYRSGAGLVRIYTPECNRTIVQTALPEAILTTYSEEKPDLSVLEEAIQWASAIVVGPGLGTTEASEEILKYIMKHSQKTVVIDADGLTILAQKKELADRLSEHSILTPHMGEMSRLTGISVTQLKQDPVNSCARYAAEHGCVLVQKDARTVVSDPTGQQIFINMEGNSGMSTGGSGDVLSGIIGSLAAQGALPYDAAVNGAALHARAGDRAAAALGERAVLAGDIVNGICRE